MMRQLAMPVKSSSRAPKAMAMTEVSQVEPGMVPISMSRAEAEGCMPAASSPIGVAPAMASLPHKSLAIHTLSPLMWVG